MLLKLFYNKSQEETVAIWKKNPSSPSRGMKDLWSVVLYQQVPPVCGRHGKDRAYFRTQIVDIDHLVTFRIFSIQQTFVESLFCADTVLNTQAYCIT